MYVSLAQCQITSDHQQAAVTVSSRIIKTFFNSLPDVVDVPLKNGLRVQILPGMEDLGRARKHQFAAFIASEALLVVWDDDPMNLISRAKSIEKELMELIWQTSQGGSGEDTGGGAKQDRPHTIHANDEEKALKEEPRQTNLINAFNVGFNLLLVTLMMGLGFRAIVMEIMVDNGFVRVAFLAMTPVQVFFSLVGHNP